jgi:hypothetical protein
MEFLRNLMGGGLPGRLDSQTRQEVEKLIEELIRIGKADDFLSEHPGSLFNAQCRHIRARAVGTRLNELGGLELMQSVRNRVFKKLGGNLASHLDYAWTDIGKWIP